MITINKNPKEISEEDLLSIKNCLDNDGVIILPSDTCYGLSCNIQSEKAVQKISKIKHRKKQSAYSIICDMSFFQDYTNINELQEENIYDFLPGPYTLIVPKSDTVPDFITNPFKHVGIRMFNCPWTNLILEMYKKPIVTTSANISDQPVSYKLTDVLKTIDENGIDIAIDFGTLPQNKPSKVIKILESGEQEIIRE